MTGALDRRSSPPTLRDVVEWDVRNWSRALLYWQSRTAIKLRGARALEIGARRGGLSLWLAAHGCDVVCSDVQEPGPEARQRHARFGVQDRVQYAALDVLRLPFEAEFDIVCFKSVLAAVGSGARSDLQARAVAEIYRALKPTGEMWFAENLAASRLHRFGRQKFVPWGATCRYVTIGELEELLAPFDEVAYDTTGFLGAFGRSERQRDILGALDQALIAKLVPKRWRYVGFGIARK